MRHPILTLFLLVGGVSVAGVGLAVAAGAAGLGADPVVFAAGGGASGTSGRKVFLAEGCNLCHSVSSAGIEGRPESGEDRGPDLAGVGERHDRRFLVGYLRQAERIDGKTHRTSFKGSDEELAVLVSWLLAQPAD